jgi:hypothetical protein
MAWTKPQRDQYNTILLQRIDSRLATAGEHLAAIRSYAKWVFVAVLLCAVAGLSRWVWLAYGG